MEKSVKNVRCSGCRISSELEPSVVPRYTGSGSFAEKLLCNSCFQKKTPSTVLPDKQPELRAKHFSSGKPQFACLPWQALYEVARVASMGAEKYGPNNWKLGMPASELENSAQRHYVAWKTGENLDPESKLNHLAHMAWNILALYETITNHPNMDDRFSKAEIDQANHQVKIFETGVEFGKATVNKSRSVTDYEKVWKEFENGTGDTLICGLKLGKRYIIERIQPSEKQPIGVITTPSEVFLEYAAQDRQSGIVSLTDRRKELNRNAMNNAAKNLFPISLICSNEKCGKIFKCYDQAQLDSRNLTDEPLCFDCLKKEITDESRPEST